MKILKTILKVLGVVFLLLIVISLFLPSGVKVERSVIINASPEAVYAHLDDLKKWEEWSPWKKLDTAMQNTYEGPVGAVGQKNSWKSEKLGDGSMTISEIKPGELVVTDLNFEKGGIAKGGVKLEKTESGTKAIWYMESTGEGVPFLMKIPGKYINLLMDGMMGPTFEDGLNNLKTLVESVPAAPQLTYTVEEVTTEDHPVIAAPPNKIKVDKINLYMGKYFPLLMAAAKKNGQVTGAPTVIYRFWDGKETELEAVLPVDKVVMQGSEFPHHGMHAGKALKVEYTGDYANMESAHNDISAYGKYKNLKLGMPWEVYLAGPMNEPDTSKWITEIYYPVQP